jgi:hypothetical protein
MEASEDEQLASTGRQLLNSLIHCRLYLLYLQQGIWIGGLSAVRAHFMQQAG